MLPFPNDHFTVRDPSAPTRRRLALSSASLPTNASGAPIDVTDQNRADGWSPGSQIMVQLPGLDVTASGVPGLADASSSLDAHVAHRRPRRDHPTRVCRSGPSSTRTPIPASLRSSSSAPCPTSRTAIASSSACAASSMPPTSASHPRRRSPRYRDGQRTTDATFESRRLAMERHLPGSHARRSPPSRPPARVGLHRRQHLEPDRPDARDPRRRLQRVRGAARPRTR